MISKKHSFFIIILFVSLLLFLLNIHIISYASVIDNVNELSDEELNEINNKLFEYEQETGIEVTIYFLNTLGSRKIDKVAYGLYSLNYDTEDGLVIIYSSLDELVYIEPGLNIKEKFNDDLCIKLSENLGANFKNRDYVSGVLSVLNMSKETVVNIEEADGDIIFSRIDTFIIFIFLLIFLTPLFITLYFFICDYDF